MAGVCNIDSENIVYGDYLFKADQNLKIWKSGLDKLEEAREMFQGCSKLEEFSTSVENSLTGLRSLKHGYQMFASCGKLKSFYEDVSSLSNGNGMFEFCSDLQHAFLGYGKDYGSDLVYAHRMFYYCTALSFGGNEDYTYSVIPKMPYLENASSMFSGTVLYDTFYHKTSGDARPAQLEFEFSSDIRNLKLFMSGANVATADNHEQFGHTGSVTINLPYDSNRHGSSAFLDAGFSFDHATIPNININYFNNIASSDGMFRACKFDDINLKFERDVPKNGRSFYLMFADAVGMNISLLRDDYSGNSYYASEEKVKLGDENFFCNLYALYNPKGTSGAYYTNNGKVTFKEMFSHFVKGNYDDVIYNYQTGEASGHSTFGIMESADENTTLQLTSFNPPWAYLESLENMFLYSPSVEYAYFKNAAFSGMNNTGTAQSSGLHFSAKSMFEGCRNMTLLDIDDDSFMYCETADKMCYGCISMWSATLGGNSFLFCSSANDMFAACAKLQAVNFHQRTESIGSHVGGGFSGARMFMDCPLLYRVYGNTSLMVNDGNQMFYRCSELSTVDVTFPSLTNGSYMFFGCKLNAESVERILNSLPTGEMNSVLDLTMDDGGCEKFMEIAGNVTLIPHYTSYNSGHTSDQPYITYKGWKIYPTHCETDYISLIQYDIVEGSQYIPDASSWNNDFASSGIVVTSVHDGYAWNDNLS